jgi:predicted nucleic acid-binding protein
MEIIVSNSGPILSFVRAKRLALLHQVVSELTIPEAVYEEIAIQGAAKPGGREIADALWIKRRALGDYTVAEGLPHKLGIGEREAIALAKELNARLLIDDREARKQAERLGVPDFGSLSVLKQAKEMELIDAVKPVLDDLISTGTYISKGLYNEFLRIIGE